jgi:MFS family permease
VGSGVSIGIIVSGSITLHNSWRVIYYVGAVMIGILLVLIIFTFPETAYNRSYAESEAGDIFENKKNPYRLSLTIILDDNEKARGAKYYTESEASQELPDEIAELVTIQRMEERIRRLEAAVLENRQYSAFPSNQSKPEKKSYWKTLALFTGERYTKESLWKMFVRPFGLAVLPPVIWATLVMSVIIGFNVALSSSCKKAISNSSGVC